MHTGHEQTQYNQVSYFHLFRVFLASEGCNHSELIQFSPRTKCGAVYQKLKAVYMSGKYGCQLPKNVNGYDKKH